LSVTFDFGYGAGGKTGETGRGVIYELKFSKFLEGGGSRIPFVYGVFDKNCWQSKGQEIEKRGP